MEPIISVSGLRGVVGESLDPERAMRYCAAYVSQLPPGDVVLTRDGRTTGRMLMDALRGALAALGRDVVDAGVAATPTTGVLVRTHQAAGGIQISASHNPPQYNGLKLFDHSGRVLPADTGAQVMERYRSRPPAWVAYDKVGEAVQLADSIGAHARLVLDNVDIQRIRRRRFRVLLDANHGAGSLLGNHLLDVLDCQIISLGDVPDGRFAHPPEPTAENLVDVCRQVTEAGADVGFCQDPDADRLAVIDQGGRYVGEEYTLALCLDHVLRSTPGPIVTNCATSRMARDIAAKYNVPFHSSPVGEANVVDLMLAEQAVFGGEGNGGPIDPRVGMVRDSFVGMTLILDAMAARDQPVSRLVDELPRYEIQKTKVVIARDSVADALDALEARFPEAESNRRDGLRLDWPNQWLLVRASNTEPIVRIIAEAETSEEAERLCREAAAVITLSQ